MISIYSGLPGAGKSLRMAQTMLDILWRNKKWYAKSGIVRPVYTNLHLNSDLEEEYKGFIYYWDDPSQLVQLRDCDVFWDEIATHLDSTQWKEVPLELKRWLQQHRKFGIDIYGTTQDFAMVDVSMRRMTGELFLLTKIIGSPDKSATRPEVRYVWGLIFIRTLNPQDYKEDQKENKARGFSFMWISKKLVQTFDTTQEILQGKYPPLKHIERQCELAGLPGHNCDYHKVLHV